MSNQSCTEKSFRQIGIPCLHRASDKTVKTKDLSQLKSNVTTVPDKLPSLDLFVIPPCYKLKAITYYKLEVVLSDSSTCARFRKIFYRVCIIRFWYSLGHFLETSLKVFPDFFVTQSVAILKALHAGTFVPRPATATSIAPFRGCTASFLLVIAALTVAFWCGNSNAAHFLDQLTHPIDPSPIYNSKIHSSSRILSSLISARDTSITSSLDSHRALNYVSTNDLFIPVGVAPQKAIGSDKRPFSKSSVNRDIENKTLSSRGDASDGNSCRNCTRVTKAETFFQSDQIQIDAAKGNLQGRQHFLSSTATSWPPSNNYSTVSSLNVWSIVGLVVSAIALTVALGVITCVVSHYRAEASGAERGAGGTAPDHHDVAHTPTFAPMLSVVSAGATAGVGGMDRLRGGRTARELASTRDRQVRLHALHTDIAINLPPSIALPDGEDHPYTNTRIHIRDAEQEAEIYQKCIRPPPNRTVLESESPPPYRSSSAGLLGSSSSSSCSSSGSNGGDWSGGSAPLVVRCHSMSSTSKRPEAGHSGQKTDFLQRTVKIFTGKKTPQQPAAATAPTLPAIVVPSRRKPTSSDAQQQGGAAPASRTKPGV